MLLSIFKINNYLAYVYLFAFSLLTACFACNYSVLNYQVYDGSLLSLFIKTSNLTAISAICSVLLLIGNVLLFDYFLLSQEITEKNNHLPAFLLGIYLSFSIAESPLHPQLFSQLLLTIALLKFVSVYRTDRALPQIFDGAFCLSCAAIVYAPCILFIPLAIIALLILRPFALREWALLLTGLTLPYLFYYALLFLFNQSIEKPVLDIVNTFHNATLPHYLKGSFLINFSSIILSAFSLFYFLTKNITNKIKTHKAFVVLLWMLLLSLPGWFVVTNTIAFTGVLSIMPLSVFCGIYVGTAKSRILAEILTWILIATFVISILQHASIIN